MTRSKHQEDAKYHYTAQREAYAQYHCYQHSLCTQHPSSAKAHQFCSQDSAAAVWRHITCFNSFWLRRKPNYWHNCVLASQYWAPALPQSLTLLLRKDTNFEAFTCSEKLLMQQNVWTAFIWAHPMTTPAAPGASCSEPRSFLWHVIQTTSVYRPSKGLRVRKATS